MYIGPDWNNTMSKKKERKEESYSNSLPATNKHSINTPPDTKTTCLYLETFANSRVCIAFEERPRPRPAVYPQSDATMKTQPL